MDEKVASVLKDEMTTENTQSDNGHFQRTFHYDGKIIPAW